MKPEVSSEDEAVLARGMDVLMRGLGVADAIRFMQLVHGTGGDYTAERRRRIDSANVDEFVAEARAHYEVGKE